MTMTRYYIRTFATEDRAETVCSYGYDQWKELCKKFKESGVKFVTWAEHRI